MVIRRAFLRFAPFAAVAAARAQDRVPSDIEALNEFALHYNVYAAALKRGVVDVKEWRRVERAWKGLR